MCRLHSTSLSTFVAKFRRAELPAYRAIQVEAEWLPPGMCLDAFGNGRRWNGWAMPYFPFDTAQLLCAEMPGLSYDTARDAFVLVDTDFPDDEQEQVFEATCIEVAGSQVKVYGIGAGAWTWDEADA